MVVRQVISLQIALVIILFALTACPITVGVSTQQPSPTSGSMDEWAECQDRCSDEFNECVEAGNIKSACALNVMAPCQQSCGSPPLD